jgi:hypothetical protein
MAKTEVYSWRLSADKKAALETEARAEGKTVAQLLDRLAEEWLASRREADDDAEQRRLHAALVRVAGTIASGKKRSSANVRAEVRDRLRRRYAR